MLVGSVDRETPGHEVRRWLRKVEDRSLRIEVPRDYLTVLGWKACPASVTTLISPGSLLHPAKHELVGMGAFRRRLAGCLDLTPA